ncbi:MAG: hypothetical protein M1820_005210 [Bogoriella megaspora]|nr:MAG: hypothetical protein M1820_005210 [Bogoriella megaspora]
MQQKPSPITHAQHAKDILRKASSEEDGMLKRLLAPRMDASPPQDYEMLQASTVKALWQYGGPILSKRFPSESETARTLRVLPALVKARIFNRSISDGERSSAASSETTRVSHSQANNLACAIRVLIDINDEHSGDRIGVLPSAVERIQSVVALREYASSEMDPQVMREMWLLQDVLAAAGEHGKAQEVRQSLIHCLGKYTQDIPPHSV